MINFQDMIMLDYFVGQALSGFTATVIDGKTMCEAEIKPIVKLCFKLANEILQERENWTGGQNETQKETKED